MSRSINPLLLGTTPGAMASSRNFALGVPSSGTDTSSLSPSSWEASQNSFESQLARTQGASALASTSDSAANSAATPSATALTGAASSSTGTQPVPLFAPPQTSPTQADSAVQAGDTQDEEVEDEQETSESVKPSLSWRIDPQASYVEPDDESFGVDDFVDIINPLHHIPILGSVYREVSGDTIKPVSRIVGDVLYGAVTGTLLFSCAASVISAAYEQQTGGEPVVQIADALFGSGDEESGQGEVKLAQASGGDSAATTATATSATGSGAGTLGLTQRTKLALASNPYAGSTASASRSGSAASRSGTSTSSGASSSGVSTSGTSTSGSSTSQNVQLAQLAGAAPAKAYPAFGRATRRTGSQVGGAPVASTSHSLPGNAGTLVGKKVYTNDALRGKAVAMAQQQAGKTAAATAPTSMATLSGVSALSAKRPSSSGVTGAAAASNGAASAASSAASASISASDEQAKTSAAILSASAITIPGTTSSKEKKLGQVLNAPTNDPTAASQKLPPALVNDMMLMALDKYKAAGNLAPSEITLGTVN